MFDELLKLEERSVRMNKHITHVPTLTTCRNKSCYGIFITDDNLYYDPLLPHGSLNNEFINIRIECGGLGVKWGAPSNAL